MKIQHILVIITLNSYSYTICNPLPKPKHCPRLSLNERKEKLKQLYSDTNQDLHWTFWLIPFLQESKGVTETSVSRLTHLYGPKKCPKMKDQDTDFDCPVRYVMEHDVNRIPENIVGAECVCENCRHGNDNSAKKCQPVYTLTRVLRRDKNCSYYLTYDRVPVACTCKSEATIRKAKVVHGRDIPITSVSYRTGNELA